MLQQNKMRIKYVKIERESDDIFAQKIKKKTHHVFLWILFESYNAHRFQRYGFILIFKVRFYKRNYQNLQLSKIRH